MRMKEYRYMKEASMVKILGEPNLSIPLINWGKEVVEESKITEKTPREDLITTFQRIQSPLWDTESPPRPKLYPPPTESFFMNGMEIATTKRKGRMTSTFFVKWPKGSRAIRAIPMRASANRPKKRREVGGELTPIKIKVKKTMIFALASRWWIGLSVLL
jgi:hypothetical protein